jgi:hypothetical protein
MQWPIKTSWWTLEPLIISSILGLSRGLGLGTQKLDRPKKIWNIDGTNNRAGLIQEYVDLEVCTGNKEQQMQIPYHGLRTGRSDLRIPLVSDL